MGVQMPHNPDEIVGRNHAPGMKVYDGQERALEAGENLNRPLL